MTKNEMHELLKSLFPDIVLHGINDDGSVNFSRCEFEFGNIRLANTRMCLYRGSKHTLANMIKCMEILGSNNYSLHTGGENYWIDFYYKMTPDEIKEAKRVKLLNELNKLDEN